MIHENNAYGNGRQSFDVRMLWLRVVHLPGKKNHLVILFRVFFGQNVLITSVCIPNLK